MPRKAHCLSFDIMLPLAGADRLSRTSNAVIGLIKYPPLTEGDKEH
jgi:hypothetical protein